MAGEARVTQVAVEILSQEDPPARATQVAIEVLTPVEPAPDTEQPVMLFIAT